MKLLAEACQLFLSFGMGHTVHSDRRKTALSLSFSAMITLHYGCRNSSWRDALPGFLSSQSENPFPTLLGERRMGMSFLPVRSQNSFGVQPSRTGFRHPCFRWVKKRLYLPFPLPHIGTVCRDMILITLMCEGGVAVGLLLALGLGRSRRPNE